MNAISTQWIKFQDIIRNNRNINFNLVAHTNENIIINEENEVVVTNIRIGNKFKKNFIIFTCIIHLMNIVFIAHSISLYTITPQNITKAQKEIRNQ